MNSDEIDIASADPDAMNRAFNILILTLAASVLLVAWRGTPTEMNGRLIVADHASVDADAPHAAAQPAPSLSGDSARGVLMPDEDAEPADRLGRRQTQITPELIDRCLEVAEEVDPAMAKRLRALCDNDPKQFEHVLRTTGRRLIGLAELKQRDPDLYDLKLREWRQEAEVSRVARELAMSREQGDRTRAEALEQELRNLVRIQVAFEIKAQGDYLRRLQEHMKALQEEIERAAANFDRTVEERMAAQLRIAARQRQLDRRDALGNLPGGPE